MNTEVQPKDFREVAEMMTNNHLERFIREFAHYTTGISEGDIDYFELKLVRMALMHRAWFQAIYPYITELTGKDNPHLCDIMECEKDADIIEQKLTKKEWYIFERDDFRLYFHPEEDEEDNIELSEAPNRTLVSFGICMAIDWLSARMSVSCTTNVLIQRIIEKLITALEDCGASEHMIEKARKSLLKFKIINDDPVSYDKLQRTGLTDFAWRAIQPTFSCHEPCEWSKYAIRVYQDFYRAIHPRDGYLRNDADNENCSTVNRVDELISGRRDQHFRAWPEPDEQLPEPNSRDIAEKGAILLSWLNEQINSDCAYNKRAQEFIFDLINQLEDEGYEYGKFSRARELARDPFVQNYYRNLRTRIKELVGNLLQRFLE